MLGEHGGGDGADAAGHGRAGAGLLRRFGGDVAAELALGVHVDAHVDQHLIGSDERLADGSRVPHGGQQHVGAAGDGGGVAGLGVADGHGGVLRQQHHRQRAADDEAAPEDDGVRAFQFDPVMPEDLHAGGWRAGRKAHGLAGIDAGLRRGGDTVHVLFGGQRRAHGRFVDVLRQRHEDQAAVDRSVGVDFGDDFQQFVLRSLGGQRELFHFQSHGRGALGRPALVGEVVAAFAHAHDGEAGGNAAVFELLHVVFELRGEGGGHGLAVQDLSHKNHMPFLIEIGERKQPRRSGGAAKRRTGRRDFQNALRKDLKDFANILLR